MFYRHLTSTFLLRTVDLKLNSSQLNRLINILRRAKLRTMDALDVRLVVGHSASGSYTVSADHSTRSLIFDIAMRVAAFAAMRMDCRAMSDKPTPGTKRANSPPVCRLSMH